MSHLLLVGGVNLKNTDNLSISKNPTILTRLFAKKTKQEDVGKYIHSTKEVKITKMLKRMSNLRNFNRSTFYCS